MCLEELGVPPESVLISNKLAWKRIPLSPGSEPTFEPGAWVNLKNDATQDISYQGMFDCFEEGNRLLGKYSARIVSVHDPDEYLAGAKDEQELAKRREDVLGAYTALAELRSAGKVLSIGVGAKDVSAIDWISDHVQLDWAMFACTITPYTHTEFSKRLLRKLGNQGVHVINSAVFHSGFLVGGENFDYGKIDPESKDGKEKLAWRTSFNELCAEFEVEPRTACVQFSFLFPQIKSVALNTSKANRVASTIDLAHAKVPQGLWDKGSEVGLWRLESEHADTLTARESIAEGTAETRDTSVVVVRDVGQPTLLGTAMVSIEKPCAIAMLGRESSDMMHS